MYIRVSRGWFKHLDFIILDVLVLQMTFLAAYGMRFGGALAYDRPVYQDMAFFLIIADVAVLFFMDTFQDVLKRGYYKEAAATTRHVCMLTLLEILYLFVRQEGTAFSRTVLFGGAFLYLVLTYLIRIFWKRMLHKRENRRDRASLLLITVSDRAEQALDQVREENYRNLKIKGIALLDRNKGGEETVKGVPVVSDSQEDILDYVWQEYVDEVIFVGIEEKAIVKETAGQLLKMGIVVHLEIEDTVEMPEQMKFVEKIGACTVLTGSIGHMTDRAAFVKRCIDIAGGLVGCMLTIILFCIVAPLIKLISPGPVFFPQTRIGKNGRRFRMYKFRSMYPDAEARKQELKEKNHFEDGKMFAVDWDPRIIGSRIFPDGRHKKGIGNFLRDYSLDEFPQFYNVLKGDMSLVGTRPPTEDEYQKYGYEHRARLSVKPGMTGMWQIRGRRKTVDFEEVVKMDMEYINTWSLGLDIKIILQTFLIMIKGEKKES